MSKEQQASKNQQSQKVFPCYSCHSTSHNIADCPHNKSPISKEIAKQFAKLRVGKKGRGGKNKGGQRGGKSNRGGKGSFPGNSGKVTKSEPKN